MPYRTPAEIIPGGIRPPASESSRKAWSTDLSDHTRFEELVLPHLNAAYNLARWLTRDVNDAEDVVQDACVRALKYVGSLHGGGARAWFLTIVRHAFYDWCKRNRPAEIVRDDGTAIDMAVDPAAVDPEQAFLRSAESKALADAVAALPLAYREVLILREMEELSYKEIARIADIPIGTVMSRLARARGLLQHSPLLQAANQVIDRVGADRVQPGGGFVVKNAGRSADDGARQTDPFAHPAGQLVRVVVREALQADERDEVVVRLRSGHVKLGGRFTREGDDAVARGHAHA